MIERKSMYIYKGKRIGLKIIEQRLPSGRIFKREIIEHVGAVVVLPIIDDKVVLLRQYRVALDKWLYELPAGTRDKEGESTGDCALRELKEETGYIAEDVVELFKICPSPGFCTEIIHVFLAQKLKKGIASPEEMEVIQTITLPFNDALELVRKEEIIDAKTIAALLYYDRYFRCHNTTS